MLVNHPYARAVVFDIERIALGSNVTIVGWLRTNLTAAVVALGLLNFAGNVAAGAAGELLAGVVMDFGTPQKRDALQEEVMRKNFAHMSVEGPSGVKIVQSTLRDLGIDPGPIDGIRGPLTDYAMNTFTVREKIRNDWPQGYVALTALAKAAAERAVP